MIRFGIISFAHIHADDYARAIKEIAEADGTVQLAAIADEDAARGQAKAKELGVPSFFSDYRKMLSDDTIDAVMIASENVFHLEHVVAAAEAGKHIVCEKPLGISEDALEKMRSAIAASGKKICFQTAFVMRYDATVSEVKRQLDSGTFGAIRAISATNHGTYPGGWFGDKELAGGGAIMDHTVHIADLIRYFTGDEFSSVRAFHGKNIRARLAVEDNAMIYARLRDSESPVSIDCSWSRVDGWPVWGDVTMELVCERGLLKLDCFRPHIDLVSKGSFSWHGLSEDLSGKMIRQFCDAIRHGGEPKASFHDGAQAAKVALAAYRSLANRSEPVTL